METVCSVSSIHNRLINWGLGDINVQRLGAKLYLLTFLDEDLFVMLEDVNWSYLKEIFSEVKPWSEKVSYKERATWLEVRSLPLHCWNGESLKNIAEIWGKMEALGVNANHTHDCEKTTILITTRHVRRIEEMVELKVGENVFPVYVKELGFTDGTTYSLCNNDNGVKGIVENSEESESNSNVNSGVKIHAAEEGDQSNSSTEGEAHEVLSTEKEFINGCFREKVLPRVLINESELVGGDPKGVSAVVDKKSLKMKEQIGGEGFESQEIEDDRSVLQKEVLKEYMGLENNKHDEQNLDPNKELDPEVEFGLKPKTDILEAEIKEGSKDKLLEPQDMWAKVLDGIANSGNTTKWIDQEDSSPDAEIEKEIYVDLDIRKGERRKKKEKRFESILGWSVMNQSGIFATRFKSESCASFRHRWIAVEVGFSKLGVVVASPAVLVVGQWVHTFSSTANLGIATLLSTHPTVEFVRFDVYAYFVAAKRARTTPHATNFRASVACEDRTRFLAEKSTCSSKRGCHLTRSFSCGGGESKGHKHGQHKEKLEEVHVFPNMELSLGRKVVVLEI
ncbi:hypothetical protein V6N13_029407 [Hibiscus sabdariffa]